MKDFLEFLTRGLVNEPEAVKVSEHVGDGTTIYELSVAQDDLGKVIGKKGRTARALRTLLQAAATKAKVRAILEILD